MDVSINKQVLASNVVRLRTENPDLSQRRLSEIANLSPAMVSKIEAGDANPSERTLKKLASALRVSVVELLTPVDGMKVQELEEPTFLSFNIVDPAGVEDAKQRNIALQRQLNNEPVYTLESLAEKNPVAYKYTPKLPWTCEGSIASKYILHASSYGKISRNSVSIMDVCGPSYVKTGHYCVIKSAGAVFLQTALKRPFSTDIVWVDDDSDVETPFNPDTMEILGVLIATFLIHD